MQSAKGRSHRGKVRLSDERWAFTCRVKQSLAEGAPVMSNER